MLEVEHGLVEKKANGQTQTGLKIVAPTCVEDITNTFITKNGTGGTRWSACLTEVCGERKPFGKQDIRKKTLEDEKEEEGGKNFFLLGLPEEGTNKREDGQMVSRRQGKEKGHHKEEKTSPRGKKKKRVLAAPKKKEKAKTKKSEGERGETWSPCPLSGSLLRGEWGTRDVGKETTTPGFVAKGITKT